MTDSDSGFADLLDDLLDRLLAGEQPDPEAAAARHPGVGDRVAEAMALASSLAGRRPSAHPTLRGYEIVRELGRGGMGTVYLARQKELDRLVALKVLPHSLGLSPASRRHFLAEARALASVGHEHIVAIHRIVEDGDLLAFEMEYIDGPSLHALLNALREQQPRSGGTPGLTAIATALGIPANALGTRNPTQFFVRLVLKVARALAAVHAAGFVHRDIKPANLLLRQDGEPVLVDFGLVRPQRLDVTQPGRFVGTPVYAAPEQLRGDERIGPAADVYSLGVTLYECLALAPPFAGRTTTDLLAHIELGRFLRLRRRAPDVPRDLETIVAHAMEVDAQRRYPDAGAFADDLQRLLELRPVSARPAGVATRIGKFARRNRLPLLAALVGALLVALLLPLLQRPVIAAEVIEHARQTVRSARLLVLRGEAAGSDRRATSTTRQLALQEALSDYEAALRQWPGESSWQLERDVVQLAQWLHTLTVHAAGGIDAALASPRFQSLTERLGPATVAMARRLAGEPAPPSTPEPRAASADDRLTLGLLCFVFGDFRGCEHAWSPPAAPPIDHPLVDAGLGRMLLADGRLEPASVHLRLAQRQFPDSAILELDLADVALRLGDIDSARRWLDHGDRAAGDTAGDAVANEPTGARLRLDLRAATGEAPPSAADYEALADAHPYDATCRHRVAQLAMRNGDLRRAAATLAQLVEQWPTSAAFRLDAARLALQRRDLGGYGMQVVAVLDVDFGRGRSAGTIADLLEVLRIGGLDRLHAEGVAATGGESSGRAVFGGELPIAAFAPPLLTRDFTATAKWLSAMRRRVRSLCRPHQRIGVLGEALAFGVPTLACEGPLARLFHLPARVLLVSFAAFAPPLLEDLAAYARNFLSLLRLGDWRAVDLAAAVRVHDLPATGVVGFSLASSVDRDGRTELLVGCPVDDPSAARGHVLVLDGDTLVEVARLVADDDGHLLGYAAATVGDLDGDGRRDWLFGCPAGTKGTPAGRAELWSAATRTRIATLDGADPAFGVAVAGLDDCDGDGIADFAVATAPLLRNTAAQGQVELFSGRTRSILRTWRNDVPGVWFGAALANVGDCDGDGLADLAIGGNYGNAPGLVRLYSVGRGTLLHTWSDPSPDSRFGAFVGPVGDFDRDGVPDLAIGAAGEAGTSARVVVCSGRTGAVLLEVRRRGGTLFGHSVVPLRFADGTTLLAIGAPTGGGPVTGTVEFVAPNGASMGQLSGPVIRGMFGNALVAGPAVAGASQALFVTGAVADPLGDVWRVHVDRLLGTDR